MYNVQPSTLQAPFPQGLAGLTIVWQAENAQGLVYCVLFPVQVYAWERGYYVCAVSYPGRMGMRLCTTGVCFQCHVQLSGTNCSLRGLVQITFAIRQ